MPDAPTVTDLLDAVHDAYAKARTDHDSGACKDSEWSCSHCEAEARLAAPIEVSTGDSGQQICVWQHADGSQLKTEAWPDGSVEVAHRVDAWATWSAPEWLTGERVSA